MTRGSNFRMIANYLNILKLAYKRLGRTSKVKSEVVLKKDVYKAGQIELLFRLNKKLTHPLPYMVAFALAIFAMLKISNLVPVAENFFTPLSSLRGEMSVSPPIVQT